MTNAQTIFLWCGIDAREQDAATWSLFQTEIATHYSGDIEFIEARTQTEWDEIISSLKAAGYTIQRPGSGAFWRLYPCLKRAENVNAASYQDMPLTWQAAGEMLYPYRAEVNGKTWRIRLNDFPDEPLYTLIIDHQEIFDFDDWPKTWKKPSPHQKL